MGIMYGRLTQEEFQDLGEDQILELHGRTYQIKETHITKNGVNYQAVEITQPEKPVQSKGGYDKFKEWKSAVPTDYVDPPVREYSDFPPIKPPIRQWARMNGWPNLKSGFIPKAVREAYIKEFGSDDKFDS